MAAAAMNTGSMGDDLFDKRTRRERQLETHPERSTIDDCLNDPAHIIKHDESVTLIVTWPRPRHKFQAVSVCPKCEMFVPQSK